MEPFPLRRGVYDGHRTAALAGVPYSTLHYWAREGIVVPSISPERVRLWSWTDLLKLRAVTWLRKEQHIGMQRVTQLLDEIDELELEDEPLQHVVLVSRNRDLYLRVGDQVQRVDDGHQVGVPDMLDLIAPFDRGPDLIRPRPHLRIIPGKLSGEPHVRDTRIPSYSIYALHRSGYSGDAILSLYPGLEGPEVEEAIDLERSLDRRAA
jgi:uncharacterized protein (DUF433 family)/DNA-binding transcriptional MerR regulator